MHMQGIVKPDGLLVAQQQSKVIAKLDPRPQLARFMPIEFAEELNHLIGNWCAVVHHTSSFNWLTFLLPLTSHQPNPKEKLREEMQMCLNTIRYILSRGKGPPLSG